MGQKRIMQLMRKCARLAEEHRVAQHEFDCEVGAHFGIEGFNHADNDGFVYTIGYGTALLTWQTICELVEQGGD